MLLRGCFTSLRLSASVPLCWPVYYRFNSLLVCSFSIFFNKMMNSSELWSSQLRTLRNISYITSQNDEPLYVYLIDLSPLGLFRANGINNSNKLRMLIIPTGRRQTSWPSYKFRQELKQSNWHKYTVSQLVVKPGLEYGITEFQSHSLLNNIIIILLC